MPVIDHRLVTAIRKDGADGLGFSDGEHYEVSNSIIDLSSIPVERLDEAAGITRGSSATFTNCVIRGAAKQILCGSGDAEDFEAEEGKCVEFHHCLIEDGCRRFPEVQDGMECILDRCHIRNWSRADRFDTRTFGAWAHDGGSIVATNCIFENENDLTFKQSVISHVNHFCQCINERGLAGFFHEDAYIPGWKRGLTAGPYGHVEAIRCWAGKGIILQNIKKGCMSLSEKDALERELWAMKLRLGKELQWDYPDSCSG